MRGVMKTWRRNKEEVKEERGIRGVLQKKKKKENRMRNNGGTEEERRKIKKKKRINGLREMWNKGFTGEEHRG